MYRVKSKTKKIDALTLDEAMKIAKEMNELVIIKGHGTEIIGLLVLIQFLMENALMGQHIPGRSEDVKMNSELQA